ncbi:roundabout homolog 2-like [Branchiostoma lanceolatum]|uniref:roundabout homolog 2-like n=1 Tax=Branchiostoma lanceolatum TaxID=7740 RepID=UPI0034535D00
MFSNQVHGRFRVTSNAELIISGVQKADEGWYVCSALNLAGSAAKRAYLKVAVKPSFSEAPEDVTAMVQEDVELRCEVRGDPAPQVSWSREESALPLGRARILDNGNLKIERVTSSDEGTYVCTAENLVGRVEGTATLTIHEPPTFKTKPRDQVIGLNRTATFLCETAGNPPPAVFWQKEGSQVPMFSNQVHGRFRVTSNAELIISGVQETDEGWYVCSALNLAGSAAERAYLKVADEEPVMVHTMDYLTDFKNPSAELVRGVRGQAVLLRGKYLESKKPLNVCGQKYIFCPDGFTVEFWMKRWLNDRRPHYYLDIGGDRTEQARGFTFLRARDQVDREDQFTVQVGGSRTAQRGRVDIPLQTWTHVAFYWKEETQLSILINGTHAGYNFEVRRLEPLTRRARASPYRLYFGTSAIRPGVTTPSYTALDEVKIWGYVRPEEEIKQSLAEFLADAEGVWSP